MCVVGGEGEWAGGGEGLWGVDELGDQKLAGFHEAGVDVRAVVRLGLQPKAEPVVCGGG